MVVGPSIFDRFGNAMNQDGDTQNGEPTDDQDTISFAIGDLYVIPSADVPKSFAALATTRSTLTVNQNYRIADVDVQLNISYPNAGMLGLTLISPAGTRIALTQASELNGPNFQNTVFDDEASQSLSDGTPPYLGSYRPVSPLSAVDNTVAHGDWQLEISNPWFFSGTLNAWTLRLVAYPPSLSADDMVVTEGDSGVTNASFTVRLSNPVSETVTVDYATANGSATATSDYEPTSGQLTFAPGETVQSVNVNVLGDTVDEPDETFLLLLSNPANASLDVTTATATIRNDEPRLTINDVTVVEGNSGTSSILVEVLLTTPSAQLVSVDYSLTAGTAVVDKDYVATSGSLTFAAGETRKTIAIDIKGELLNEYDETFHVNLRNSANALIDRAQGIVTISNDDPLPTLSINDVKTVEGDSATKTFSFTATLSAASGRTVAVDFATQDGTAAAATDYAGTSGTLTFLPGQTSKSIAVVVAGDTSAEVDERFYLRLSNPSGALLLDAEGVGLIQNDDTSIAILNAPSVAGDSDISEAVFAVSLSAAVDFEVRVNYTTANGTAAAASDYAATSGVLVLAPGETSGTIGVLVLGDSRNETDETFLVNLSSPVNALLADSQGQVSILDDDPLPRLSISDVSVTEGNSGTKNLNFVVTLSQASGRAVTVQYATTDGTATAGSDYSPKSGTLSFGAGAVSQTISVAVDGDTLAELDETMTVVLSGAVNATLDDSQAEGSLIDDDNLTISDVVLVEGDSGYLQAIFTVALAIPLDHEVRANYATANGTAASGSDYLASTGTIVLPPGETARTVAVPILSDRLDEGDETFSLNLTQAVGTVLSDALALATITDDDALPSLTISDVTVGEGNSGTRNLAFSIRLSAASGRVVTVQYSTADQSATAGSDYVAKSGTSTFNVGTVVQTVSITVNGDTSDESTETFALNLSNPINASVDDTQAVGTIASDDPLAAISIADAKIVEGNTGSKSLGFTVSLSAASTQPVVVSYATANATADSGSDYVATSGTLTFAAGQTSKTVLVTVMGDTPVEADENFLVRLTSPSGGQLLDAEGVGLIQNDDTNLTINDVSVTDGDNGVVEAVLTVSMATAVDFEVRVGYATANGTATLGSDYASTGGVLVFPAGQTTQTVSVFILGDTRDEVDEKFSINLTNPINAQIADGQGQVTILDDDPLPRMSISDVTLAEGNSGTRKLNFEVNLSEASGRTVTVQYATSDGSAKAGTDYVAKSGTLSFGAGAVSQTVSVTIQVDTVAEVDEFMAMTLSGVVGAILEDGQAQGTIQDDDNLTLGDVVLVEGHEGHVQALFSIGLVVPLTHEVRVNYATANGTAGAGSDYWAVSGTLVLPPGQTAGTVAVEVLGDSLDEGDETILLNLTAPVGTLLGDTQGIVTITDDDPLPSITVSDVTIAEGNSGTKNATFVVNLSTASGRTVSVQYATADGTATAGSDYVTKSGTLSFGAGQLTQSVNVVVQGDLTIEAIETIVLNLSSPVNAVLDDNQAAGSILNDDESGGAGITAASTATTGGDSNHGSVRLTKYCQPTQHPAKTAPHAPGSPAGDIAKYFDACIVAEEE